MKFSAKKVFSYLRLGKMNFHHFWPPPKKNFGYSWKNPLLATPGKNFSDAHAYANQDLALFCHSRRNLQSLECTGTVYTRADISNIVPRYWKLISKKQGQNSCWT